MYLIDQFQVVRLKGEYYMRYTIAVAALLSAMALSACERQSAVAPPPPPPVVINVPGPAGPAGPQGAAGAPAEKGATGATGMTGAQGEKGGPGDGTIVVVPVPNSQR